MNKSQPTMPTAADLLPMSAGGDHGTRGKAGPARRTGSGFPLRRWLWKLGLLVAVCALGFALAFRHIDLVAISRTIEGFNSGLVLLLMAFLPLIGFPISVVYLVVGVRFGPLGGLPVVIGVTAFHLLATYWITRSFLRARLQRLLARRGHHLPHIVTGEHAGVCLLAALVPGPPYFVRNYLLAFTDIPFRTYFWVCLSVYVVRSYVAILLGDLAGDPDRGQFLILAGVYALKLGLCAYVVWRLRRHHQRKAAAASAGHKVAT